MDPAANGPPMLTIDEVNCLDSAVNRGIRQVPLPPPIGREENDATVANRPATIDVQEENICEPSVWEHFWG
jgi:hypothetical protein